jgi:hypothetical protein
VNLIENIDQLEPVVSNFGMEDGRESFGMDAGGEDILLIVILVPFNTAQGP